MLSSTDKCVKSTTLSLMCHATELIRISDQLDQRQVQLNKSYIVLSNIQYLPESKTTSFPELELHRQGVVLESGTSISKKAGSRDDSATVARGRGVYMVKARGIRLSFYSIG